MSLIHGLWEEQCLLKARHAPVGQVWRHKRKAEVKWCTPFWYSGRTNRSWPWCMKLCSHRAHCPLPARDCSPNIRSQNAEIKFEFYLLQIWILYNFNFTIAMTHQPTHPLLKIGTVQCPVPPFFIELWMSTVRCKRSLWWWKLVLK